MSHDIPEETMTFGELLTLIHEQQQRLRVMEDAFSQLVTALDRPVAQQLLVYLTSQAAAPENEPVLQLQYAGLAGQLSAPSVPPSPDAEIPL